MSQDLRDYTLYRVDRKSDEATQMSVTATVGPTGEGEIEDTRGVQITLMSPGGVVYGRISEPQARDLIETLERRLDPDDGEYEATGWGAERLRVYPDGTAF